MPLAAALIVALLGTVGRHLVDMQPAVQPTRVSVLIADFSNNTKDPAFDRTLEPMLKRALESAGFITAFDRDGIRRTLGVQPPERLDEAAARALAIKQGWASCSPARSSRRVAATESRSTRRRL